MRLFIYLWLSAIIATMTCWVIIYFSPQFPPIKLAGSAIFVSFLTSFIGLQDSPYCDSEKVMFLVPLLFIASIIVGSFVGIFTFDSMPFILTISSFPMEVIGYYPSGPDMLFAYGATLWAVTTLALIFIGIFFGSLVRDRRRRIAHTDAD